MTDEATKLADRLDVSDMQRFPSLSRADELLIVHALRLASQREDVIDREAIARAYEAGAMDIHDEWIASEERGYGVPRGDPEFSEAANDYADAIARSLPSREAIIEECAKACDQVRNNCERRAGIHENGEARNSALDKMEGAIQCGQAIRAKNEGAAIAETGPVTEQEFAAADGAKS